jgi:TM2 domain-containing membrane protein YozV
VSQSDLPKQRSPAVATAFSVVLPGLGQAYSGRFGEAASALMVNGLFGLAIWQLIERELYFGAGAAGFFGVAFYGGNITSANQGAHRYNRLQWERWVDKQRALGRWTLEAAGGGLQAQ